MKLAFKITLVLLLPTLSVVAQTNYHGIGLAYVFYSNSIPVELTYAYIKKQPLGVKVKMGTDRYFYDGGGTVPIITSDHVHVYPSGYSDVQYAYSVSGYYLKVGLPFGKVLMPHFETYWTVYDVMSRSSYHLLMTVKDDIFQRSVIFDETRSAFEPFACLELEKTIIVNLSSSLGISFNGCVGIQLKDAEVFNKEIPGFSETQSYYAGQGKASARDLMGGFNTPFNQCIYGNISIGLHYRIQGKTGRQ